MDEDAAVVDSRTRAEKDADGYANAIVLSSDEEDMPVGDDAPATTITGKAVAKRPAAAAPSSAAKRAREAPDVKPSGAELAAAADVKPSAAELAAAASGGASSSAAGAAAATPNPLAAGAADAKANSDAKANFARATQSMADAAASFHDPPKFMHDPARFAGILHERALQDRRQHGAAPGVGAAAGPTADLPVMIPPVHKQSEAHAKVRALHRPFMEYEVAIDDKELLRSIERLSNARNRVASAVDYNRRAARGQAPPALIEVEWQPAMPWAISRRAGEAVTVRLDVWLQPDIFGVQVSGWYADNSVFYDIWNLFSKLHPAQPIVPTPRPPPSPTPRSRSRRRAPSTRASAAAPPRSRRRRCCAPSRARGTTRPSTRRGCASRCTGTSARACSGWSTTRRCPAG